MSTALVTVGDMERMALAFSKSGMFGAKTQDQALALLLLAQAEGQHPAIAMRDFDVIQGRPAKKAEAMLRSFLGAGGSVEWHTLTDECADATFSHPQGGKARIKWDLAMATKAGLAAKDNYKKFPRAMLRSRVVSEGCRTIYPAATSGMYVPEEVREFGPAPKAQPERDMGPAVVVDTETGEIDPPADVFLSPDQCIALEDEFTASGKSKTKFLTIVGKKYGTPVERLSQIKAEDFADALAYATK